MDPHKLPPHVKEYIEGLSDDDVKTLKDTVELFKSIKGWCRITRWLFFTVLAGAILVWQGVNAFKQLIGTAHPHIGG